MNKTIAAIAILLTIYSSTAQKTNKKDKPYNRWSIEANFGNNKPIEPFYDGYFSSGDNVFFNAPRINHFDIGVRHMFNTQFGLKFDVGIDDIKNQKGTSSPDFHTRQNRIGVQGIINLGRILSFENFTSSWSFLAHGGVQASIFELGKHGYFKSEYNGGILVGLSPIVRLGKHFSLVADFTALTNVRQHYYWDGHPTDGTNKSGNLSGKMFNTTLGLTWYVGKKEKHADWYVKSNIIESQDIKILNQKQYINIYFDLNKDEPVDDSNKNIYYIMNFLKTFTSTKIILSGYMNPYEEIEPDLAYRRAKNLKDIFVANNIDEERITTVSNEEDIYINGFEEEKGTISTERKVSVTLISIR